MEVLVPQLFTGLSTGAVLLLVALGLTFTFGQMGVINMAHGEFIMVGAYTAFVLQGVLGPLRAGSALLLALPLAFLVAGLLGLVLEGVLIRHLHERPLDTLLATWGISLVLQQGARDLFGAPNVQVVKPDWLAGGIHTPLFVLPWTRLFILVLVAVCIGAIAVFLHRSGAGRRMRAVMQNRQLAGVGGVATRRVDGLTFLIGSGLAGVAGVALTLLGPIGPSMGPLYLVDAFLVVIVGGLGKLQGAVIAALAIGLLSATVEFWTQASIAKAIAFAAVVAFLQVRPQGLFTFRSRALT